MIQHVRLSYCGRGSKQFTNGFKQQNMNPKFPSCMSYSEYTIILMALISLKVSFFVVKCYGLVFFLLVAWLCSQTLPPSTF